MTGTITRSRAAGPRPPRLGGIRRALGPAALTVAATILLTGCGTAESDAASGTDTATHTVTDMAGREVTLPTDIDRVATVGSVPVLNSFLFALGEGDVIVNGLPEFASGPRHRFQAVFSPGIDARPRAQGSDNTPNVETLLSLEPQVVLVMNPNAVADLEAAGLPTVVLAWRDAEDVKEVVDLLGTVLDRPDRADAYSEYFDDALDRVGRIAGAVPDDQRTTALHLNPKGMTRPHLIAEWWIEQAGGISVTREMGDAETLTLDAERIVAADPQVIFVNSPADVDAVYADERLAPVAAVRAGRVHALPSAAHTWGNRTSEQPLTVMWVADKLYPDRFAEFDLDGEVQNFYASIYHTDLTTDQVAEIVSGQ